MMLGTNGLSGIAATFGVLLLAAPSFGVTQNSSEAIEEVVVTARQREERIEDVPAAIKAFSNAEIRSAGIERPQDFIALTPGVSVSRSAEAGDMQVSIRGINTGRDAETNFALLVDGVLQTNPFALNQELSEVTQIEILKGPQGAVYGRNAVAGAMILTTRKPGDKLELSASAGVGSDRAYKASARLSGPLGDNLKGSLSVYTRDSDGQRRNLLLDCDDCVDFFRESGATARLLMGVLGGDLDFKAKYSNLKSGAIVMNADVALVDAATFLGIPSFYADPNEHDFRYINNIAPKNEQKNINFSLRGDWDLGFAGLTSYVAYNRQDNYFLTDGTSAAFSLYANEATGTCRTTNDATLTDPGYGSPFFAIPSSIWFTPAGGGGAGFLPPLSPTTCDGYQYQQRDQEDKSVELRLTSPGNQILRWVGGLYAADIDRHVIVAQGGDLNRGFQATGFVPSTGPNPTDLLYNDMFNSKVYAAFGQIAYDVIDNVELALAARYDIEDRDVENKVPTCSAADVSSCRSQTAGFASGSTPYLNPAYTVSPALATAGIPERQRRFSQFQPKVSANWTPSSDFSLFASYGYGFRSGGFNSSGSEATVQQYYGGLALSDGTPNISDVQDVYKKEVSKAAELGFKSHAFDHRLSLNAAIFRTKVDDMQFFNFFPGPFGLLRVVTNIDEVTIQGAEMDFRWKVINALSVFGGVAYTDGKINEYDGRPYTEGNEVPYAPEYTGNAGAQLSFAIGTNLELVSRVDATFTGKTWFHPVQKQKLPNLFTAFGFGEGEFSKMSRDPYAVLNLRIGLQGPRWGVTAWARNLADKRYLEDITPTPEFGGSFLTDASRRSYGLDVDFRL